MIINETEPYAIVEVPADIDICVQESHSPYLDDMMDQKVMLLRFHAHLHMTGQQDTHDHDVVVAAIGIISEKLEIGFRALWN